MKTWHPSRREIFLGVGGLAAGSLTSGAVCTAPVEKRGTFRYCLNTSTIGGQKLGLLEDLDVAANAGYEGVEPWIRKITAWLDEGGTLPELKQRIADLGLTVESAIDFAPWIIDDPEERRQALETARKSMDILAQIGGKRIAAPPSGATKGEQMDLLVIAERYRALLELGDETGIVPELEIWGHSVNLSRLGFSACAAIETGHPKACLLPDVFHLYKGGSDFTGLKLLSGDMIPVMHINDYPADTSREAMKEADRIMPGDGIAPLTQILHDLTASGGETVLSLELFNRSYWKQDALDIASLGLEKMKAAVAAAIG